ncbi:MAG TPA: CHAT domain-containing tetratricopeptide repeat protein [Pyrinomonadaceae bacterium]|jgi:CHAT domain-containing protein
MKSRLFPLVYALVTAIVLASSPAATLQARRLDQPAYIASAPTAQQQLQAGEALAQGRKLLKRGKADQALGLFNTALNLFTAAGNDKGVAAAHDGLGDLYVRQGQYDVALAHYRSAHDSFRAAQSKQSGVATAIGVADNGYNANLMMAKIGETNFRLGRISEASAAYSQIQVQKPESTAAKVSRLGGLGGLGSIMSGGRPSISAPTGALGIAMEAKKELDQYRISIIYATVELGMGRIDYSNNQMESAKKHFQNALDTVGGKANIIGGLGQSKRFRAAARISLGDVALQQGKYKDAAKFYNDAAKGAQEDKRLDLIWPAQRGLGKSLWLQAGQDTKSAALREQSLAAYRNALKTLETLRQGSLRADEARTTFLATTKDVFDEAAGTLAEMALLTATPGAPLSGPALEYAAEAFKVTEQSRARSLLDMLGETNAQITEGVPAELLKRKQDNLDRQQDLAQNLSGINVSADEPKQKPAEIEAELDRLQTEYDVIENEIRAASPRYAALTAAQPLTLAEVQQKVLDDKTVLLEYNLGNDRSYLWAMTNNSVSLYKLPARSVLDKMAMDFRAQLIPAKLQRRLVGIDVASDQTRGLGLSTTAPAPAEVAGFTAASNALYKTAVEPAASVIVDKRVLVVADGALNYVPFEAFVKTTDGTDYSALSYMIKSNEIAYAPSASVVAAIRQQPGRPAGRGVLLVADPVFNSNDTRARGTAAAAPAGQGANAATRGLGLGLEVAVTDVSGQPVSPSTGAGGAPAVGLPLARLSGTRLEADQIAKLARASGGQADQWMDLTASEENFESRDIKNYRIVHIATHGLLNAERPQFTGLVLSLVGNKTEDGFLRTDEIFNLKLGAPLVMLSACETGLGKERRGEGVIGLTRAFMYAGAPTVGVSLWSVADRSTAELMTDFYRRLLAGKPASPTAAMRDAQVAMITGKKYSAPFYWAPFVLVGEWR